MWKKTKKHRMKAMWSARIQWSLFAFNHDDVVAKLCLHWRICVHGLIHCAGRQCERSLLKRSHHRSAGHPAQVTLSKVK